MEAERLDVVVSEFGIWLVTLTIIRFDTPNSSQGPEIGRVDFLLPLLEVSRWIRRQSLIL